MTNLRSSKGQGWLMKPEVFGQSPISEPIGLYDFETGQVQLFNGQTLGQVDVGRLQRFRVGKPEPRYADNALLVPYDQLERK